MSPISQNLAHTLDRIANAARRSGRSADEVQLVAVTKTRSIEQIEALLAAGQTVLGENRVQEALPKIEALGDRAQWHLIGHLQTNKAKYVPGKFALVHSADSAKVLQALNDAGAKKDVVISALLQANMSREEQKAGCEPAEAFALFELADSLPFVRLCGLMTMAALVEDPEAARPAFAALRDLKERLLRQGIPADSLQHLSMGMSNDFEAAIEEGATIVRVGSALFADA